MAKLDDEIKELKKSFDDCDFGGGETKRLFEIIEQLKDNVEFYKDQYEYAEKGRTEWIKKFNEESIQKTKYRCAFECLFEKVSSKSN